MVCGATLGCVRGRLAMLVGAGAGLFAPICSRATAGYILGFVCAASAVGCLAERGGDRRVLVAFASLVAGQLIHFGFGVPWPKLSTGVTRPAAIRGGSPGVVKIAVAPAAGPSAWVLVRSAER